MVNGQMIGLEKVNKRLIVVALGFFVACLITYSASTLFALYHPINSISETEVPNTIIKTQELLQQKLATEGKVADSPIDSKDYYKTSSINIIIPKIGLNLGVFSGSEKVLEEGIWNRFPDRFWSEKSNVVLSGHRFSIGFNPLGIDRQSPLLHADKLEKGDIVYLVSANKTVKYKISDKFLVKNNSFWIEDNTSSTKLLTLYTCGEEGASGDRLVFRAEAV